MLIHSFHQCVYMDLCAAPCLQLQRDDPLVQSPAWHPVVLCAPVLAMRMRVKPAANYYVKQVSKLKQVLKSEAQKLSQLVQDTDALRQREHVLQLCIAQMMTSVVAMKELMLPSCGTGSQPLDALRLITALRQIWHGQQGPVAAATAVPCSTQVHHLVCSTVASVPMQHPRGRQLTAAPSPGLQQQRQQLNAYMSESLEQQPSTQGGCSMSYILAELELHIQTALHQGKCQEVPGSELYTTAIISRLMQDRQRLAKLSALSTQQLLASRRDAVRQFGFLLPRYDSNHLASSGSFAKQQVDLLVDHQVEMMLARGLAGQPLLKLEPLMVDMDTGQQQEVPHGWWKQVVKALELTEQQRASFRCLWTFSSAAVQQLVTEYQQQSMRLMQLLQQQLEAQRQFDTNCRAVFRDNIQQPPSLADCPQLVAVDQPRQLMDVQQSTELPIHSLRDNPLLKMLFPEQVNSLAAAMRDAVCAEGGCSSVAASAAGGAASQPDGRVTATVSLPLAQLHLSTRPMAEILQQQPGMEHSKRNPQAGTSHAQQAVQLQHLGRHLSQTPAVQQKDSCHLVAAAAASAPAVAVAAAAAAADENQPSACGVSSSSGSLTTALMLLVSNPGLSYEPWTSEQQELQEQLTQVMHKLSVLLFMHEMQMMNVLSKKQLALAAVHSYPYCVDAFSVCLALLEVDQEKGDDQDAEQPGHSKSTRSD